MGWHNKRRDELTSFWTGAAPVSVIIVITIANFAIAPTGMITADITIVPILCATLVNTCLFTAIWVQAYLCEWGYRAGDPHRPRFHHVVQIYLVPITIFQPKTKSQPCDKI